MRKLGLVVAAAAMVGLFAGSAWAGSLPSSKAAIVQGDLFGLASACVLDTQDGNPLGLACKAPPTDGDPADTGFNTVMTTFIKTPNGKELAFDVGLQCGLITFTQAKAKGGGGSGSDKAAAEGRISVRVAITPVDKDGGDIGDTFYALPDNDGGSPLATDASAPAEGPQGVTYCFRFQKLEVSFANLVCEEGEDCEIAVSLLLETLEAHAFNFVAPNVTSGIKKIEVQARATADADIFGGDGNAKGEAFVGIGSMLVETVRAVQAFDSSTGINPDITDLQ